MEVSAIDRIKEKNERKKKERKEEKGKEKKGGRKKIQTKVSIDENQRVNTQTSHSGRHVAISELKSNYASVCSSP